MVNNKYSFFKDFKWYLFGSFIPLLIGFIKTPVFTSQYTKSDFGKLALVQVTFSFISIFLFSWLGSCIWRYYEYYNTKKKLNKLYSNILFLHIISALITSIIATIWCFFLTEDSLTKKLILLSLVTNILSQFFNYYMVFVRLKGKAIYYNTINSIKITVTFILALVFIFVLNLSIVSLVLNLVIMDIVFFLYLILKNPLNLKFKRIKIKKSIINKLLTYGSAGLLINFAFVAIMTSDRFILERLLGIESVGVYDQTYKLSHLLGYTVFLVFLNTINPNLNRILEHNFKKSTLIIEKYINLLLVFGLPFVTYLSLFSKDIAFLLLGKPFQSGYVIMPYIICSTLFFVLINFFEMRLKFSNKLKKLIVFVLSATLLNIILTIYFVPKFNIKGAAIATLITYVFLFVILYINDSKVYRFTKKNGILILKVTTILITQIIIYIYFKFNFVLNILLISMFIISYLILLKKTIKQIEIPLNKSDELA